MKLNKEPMRMNTFIPILQSIRYETYRTVIARACAM